MAGVPARTRNQRTLRVAALSRLKLCGSAMAAIKFSAGVMVAVFVRGVTISTSSRAGSSRRLPRSHTVFALSFDSVQLPLPRALLLDHTADGPVLLHHALELSAATSPPRSISDGLGKGDDVA